MKRLLSLSAGAAFAILLLSGCATTPDIPLPRGNDSPEPVPTVTVTVTAPPVAAPDYGFTFFYGAKIGTSWSDMSAGLHTQVGPADGCATYGPLWETALSNTYAFIDPRTPQKGASFFYTDKFLAPDNAPFPRNAENVGVGSSKADVLAAYPGAVVGSVEDLGAGHIDTITVDDPNSDSKYVFGINGGAGPDTIDLLQWGPGAGTQWSHLCIGL